MVNRIPSDSTGLGDGLGRATIAAAVLGLVSTLGDWLWARTIPDGAVVPGILHGLVIFAVLALVLGWAAGSRRTSSRLLGSLPPAGLLIAAAFYPIAGLTGYLTALLISWIAMWLALALLQGWARGGGETVARAIARGLLSAVASGLAFWSISRIWTDPGAAPSYALRLLHWTWAFLPGFAVLLWRQPAALDRD